MAKNLQGTRTQVWSEPLDSIDGLRELSLRDFHQLDARRLLSLRGRRQLRGQRNCTQDLRRLGEGGGGCGVFNSAGEGVVHNICGVGGMGLRVHEAGHHTCGVSEGGAARSWGSTQHLRLIEGGGERGAGAHLLLALIINHRPTVPFATGHRSYSQ